MAEKFDYAKSVERLEEIAKLVEDPRTGLDSIAPLVEESRLLIEQCRGYLRTVRESIEEKKESNS